MLGTVALAPRRIDDYIAVVGEKPVAELRALAAPLKGLRLVGLSMTAFGSWLTDLLSTSIPLLHDLGLQAEWRVVRTDQEFAPLVRALYESLSGTGGRWTSDLRRQWERYSAVNAPLIEPRYDVVVALDPQLLGLIRARHENANGRRVRWIWRNHLDLSSAAPDAWEMLRPFAEQYDAAIFEDSEFAPPDWQRPLAQIVRPGIDPLGPRNAAIGRETASMIAERLGIDANRPLIAQLAPFEEGSDVLGLIEVFDALLPRFPNLQLAIVPTFMRDDEQTREYFRSVAELAGGRPGVVLLSRGEQIGNVEINAICTIATLVAQKSLRKGFALWLSEAMWKEQPVVAGRTPGAVAQIRDGETGYLVPDTATFVARAGDLLAGAALRHEMGVRARRHVADHYLITRYLSDALRILSGVVGLPESR